MWDNSSSYRQDDQIFDLKNRHKTKDLKNGSSYKKVRVSCEAVSSVKYK